MTAAKATVCRISRSTLQHVSRALLFVLLFNVAAFASQACVAPVASSAIVDLSVPPCESEAEGCLAELFANDGALQSRRVVAVPSASPTAPLVIAAAAAQPRFSHWDAWPLPEPLAPLRLQICRLLI
jgi:hypothetical protein